jgi:hypothetical protein
MMDEAKVRARILSETQESTVSRFAFLLMTQL